MRSSTRVIVLACLLLAPTVLVPVASAEWARVHGWGWKDARQNLAWALDEDERLHFATLHEKEFLLYEEGSAFNLSTWFVRPFQGIEKVAVAEVGGEWGVLWLERVPRDAYGKGVRSEMHFAWPVTESDVAVTSLGGAFPPWHAHHVDPVTGELHFLRVDGATATRYSLDPHAWDLTTGEAVLADEDAPGWSTSTVQFLTRAGRMQLLPNGSVFGAEWSTDGLRAVMWNGTGAPSRVPLSTYWDYQDARLSHAPNGTLSALVSYRHDACDLFVKAPDANWSVTRVEPCPLKASEGGVHAFRLLDDGTPLALTDRGFWTPGVQKAAKVPCNDAPHGWSWRPDGREFMLGPGPNVWERVPVPNVTATSDPALDAPTGFAVTFRLDGNLSALTDPVVKWTFPGSTANGAEVTHAFLSPGNFTVRATVESGPDSCRGIITSATVPIQVTGPDRAPPPTSEDGLPPGEDADVSGNETGGSFVPAPALPALVLALAVAVALSRRRA